MKHWLASAAIFLVAGSLTSVFFINFCAAMFQCGCQSLWAGADLSCNIHASHGRHCPWCVYGYTGYALIYGSMILAQALTAFGGVLLGWNWPIRLILSILAFPITGLVLGLVLGWKTGYWN